VEIRRQGYVTRRDRIVITDADNQVYKFRLAKLPGILDVKTPVAARVSVGGKDVGAAPGAIRLPAGRHEVLVTAPRYLPFKAIVDMQGMEQRQSLVPQLIAAWAPVRVLTEPAGAAVWVDGAEQGTTPARLELDAGTHRIELRHPGFKRWESDLQVVANEPQTLGPVRLGLPDSTLVVRTEPAGASVSVGGAFRGRAPITLDVRPDIADVAAACDYLQSQDHPPWGGYWEHWLETGLDGYEEQPAPDDEEIELALEGVGAGAIAFVEWPDSVLRGLPDPRVQVEISHGGGDARVVRLTGSDPGMEASLEALCDDLRARHRNA
jgi:hypothetical protein